MYAVCHGEHLTENKAYGVHFSLLSLSYFSKFRASQSVIVKRTVLIDQVQ